MRWLLTVLLAVAMPLNYAAGQASPYSIQNFPAQSFTATGQTGAVIQLNGLTTPSSTVGSSFASGAITVTGAGITTATFGLIGSADNGVTYYPLLISPVAAPTTTGTTATVTGNALYQVGLAGLTHVKFVTSGTFTAASLSLKLVASPNAQISRSSGSGPGAGVSSFNSRTGAVTLSKADVTGVGALDNDTTGTSGNTTKVNSGSLPLSSPYVGTDSAGRVVPAASPGSGIDLQTNGVDNGSQTQLNQVAGDGIVITNSGGIVTFSLGTAFAITGFAGGSTVEIGASVVNPAFTASYTATPSAASITNSDGISSPTTLNTPYTSGTVTGTFTKATQTSTIFTLSATGPSGPKTTTQAISWLPRSFGGVGAAGATATVTASGTNAVLSTGATLASAGLAATVVGKVYGAYSPAGQKIYLLVIGNAHTFKDNSTGFSFAFNSPTAVSFTNANGSTVAMYLYESTNTLTGTFSVLVAS